MVWNGRPVEREQRTEMPGVKIEGRPRMQHVFLAVIDLLKPLVGSVSQSRILSFLALLGLLLSGVGLAFLLYLSRR